MTIPPTGKFVEVDGVRLHYFERGDGEPLVLLHGIDSAIQDFQSSGLIEMAAKKYRVIVFDRPGFGHSERPRGVIWSPEKQADLIHRALGQIGVSRAIVLGHSWGASVAVALALKHPSAVASLVLVSGYYYATARADVVAASGALVPILGDIMSYTFLPVMKRLMWPLAIWLHRGTDGVAREEQLIVDFVQSATGCDRLYVGRSMADAHRGMGLSAKDWDRTVDLLRGTMTQFSVPPDLQTEVVTLVGSTRSSIVECEADKFGCR